MFTLTDNAIHAAKEKFAKFGSENARLRIGVAGSGCSGFALCLKCDGGDLRAKDTELKFDDLIVVIDAKSLAVLAGATIDYEKSLMQEGFVLRSEKVQSYCSCGSSFNL
jgi:iron-sulfur cluster insertion protein